MNPDPFKLRQQQREVETQTNRQTQSSVREFASVEEMIRQDRQETVVPPAVAERLNESISSEPKPVKSWWRRLFE